MKIREGLVSNSSSTSFMVIVADKKKTKVRLSFEVDLGDYADKNITTIEELNYYFICDYGNVDSDPTAEIEKVLKENSFLKERYENAKRGIEQGKVILIGRFSSEGEPEEQFLYEYGIEQMAGCSEDVEILKI